MTTPCNHSHGSRYVQTDQDYQESRNIINLVGVLLIDRFLPEVDICERPLSARSGHALFPECYRAWLNAR